MSRYLVADAAGIGYQRMGNLFDNARSRSRL
jgi:hypothetical protein